jgi:hypothetical protein
MNSVTAEPKFPISRITGHVTYQDSTCPPPRTLNTLATPKTPPTRLPKVLASEVPEFSSKPMASGVTGTCYPWLHLKHPRESDEWFAQDVPEHST